MSPFPLGTCPNLFSQATISLHATSIPGTGFVSKAIVKRPIVRPSRRIRRLQIPVDRSLLPNDIEQRPSHPSRHERSGQLPIPKRQIQSPHRSGVQQRDGGHEMGMEGGEDGGEVSSHGISHDVGFARRVAIIVRGVGEYDVSEEEAELFDPRVGRIGQLEFVGGVSVVAESGPGLALAEVVDAVDEVAYVLFAMVVFGAPLEEETTHQAMLVEGTDAESVEEQDGDDVRVAFLFVFAFASPRRRVGGHLISDGVFVSKHPPPLIQLQPALLEAFLAVVLFAGVVFVGFGSTR
mmetsp:Transcript_31032/g.63938  ORF Transcript_31032/g.63938 Transcript_31032/m.63938 type:complete len:293 (-) Transcript_31032:404-1282(-)